MTDRRTIRLTGFYPSRDALNEAVHSQLALGRSNAQIAIDTGVSEATVSRIRNGDHSVHQQQPITDRGKLRRKLDKLWLIPSPVHEDAQ